MKKTILLLLCLCIVSSVSAQDYFPKNDGVKEDNHNYTAFTNATLYISPSQVVKKATLLIQDGKVVASGKSVSIPQNSIVIDLDEKYIYPSFIESYSGFGLKKPERKKSNGAGPQYDASREGFYWNDHIMPETNAIDQFKYDKKKAKELREAGFGTVNTHLMDGIARGTGVLVALNDEGGDQDRILEDASAQFFSFSKSVASRQSYPTSLMGGIALLRQMYSDMDWYAKGNSKTKDRSLEAMIKNKKLVSIFEAGDKGNNVRADKIADQFGVNYVIVGGGDEYEAIESIKSTQARYIIPLDFPAAFDVSNPYQAKYVSLEDMRAWNQAPTNPKVLADNGISFSLTTHDLDKVSEFKKNLMKAIEYGLSKTKALEALTTVPASIIGKSNTLGTLEAGKHANFLITSGDIFDKETTLHENWVQGKKHVINNKDQKDIRGKYTLSANGKNYQMEISGKDVAKPKIKVMMGETEFPSTLTYKENWITFSFSDKDKTQTHTASGIIKGDDSSLSGRLITPNGTESSFTATRTGKADKGDKDKKDP
ncbi:MAG: amidohydrolase family protein, partial [Bacteroidetes bacterium]|nr:amidohydrolase family protein [Bacteroidota bacterium]